MGRERGRIGWDAALSDRGAAAKSSEIEEHQQAPITMLSSSFRPIYPPRRGACLPLCRRPWPYSLPPCVLSGQGKTPIAAGGNLQRVESAG
eukprot:COSAG05_NODE_2775_length_2652_cov_2.252252_4_plen_91_part_00